MPSDFFPIPTGTFFKSIMPSETSDNLTISGKTGIFFANAVAFYKYYLKNYKT